MHSRSRAVDLHETWNPRPQCQGFVRRDPPSQIGNDGLRSKDLPQKKNRSGLPLGTSRDLDLTTHPHGSEAKTHSASQLSVAHMRWNCSKSECGTVTLQPASRARPPGQRAVLDQNHSTVVSRPENQTAPACKPSSHPHTVLGASARAWSTVPGRLLLPREGKQAKSRATWPLSSPSILPCLCMSW
jgi:hypothetical protein